MSRQLGIDTTTDLTGYRDGKWRFAHAAQIRTEHGYRDLADRAAGFGLRGRRPPPTRRACSASTRQRCRGYSGGPRSSLLPYFRFHCSPSPKINRALVFELATARFVAQREDALLLGAPGTGKSHIAQAIGRAAIQQGYRVIYREAHTFLEELAEATLADTRKALLDELSRVPLLIIDDLGMRKLPHTAAEDLLELIMRRYERASTILTSNRPVEDWGKLLGDTAAVTALLDRLLHHAHVLKCGPRSWRTKVQTTLRSNDAVK